MFLRTLIVFLPLLSPALGIYAQEPEKAEDPVKGKIAFIGDKNGSSNIYLVNPDGSGLKQVTDDPEGLGPMVSIAPNGKKLVATVQKKIILFDLEDGSRKKLASTRGYFPTWSPDGGRIAFNGEGDSCSYICIVDTAGEEVEKLTDGDNCPLWTTWGPKGKRLVYQGKGYDLFSVHVEEPHPIQRLTHTGKGPGKPPVARKIPTWSPDGDKIAFHAGFLDTTKSSGLYMTDRNGEGLTLIRKGSFRDQRAWTADGQHLLVSLTGEHGSDLYLIDLEGEIVREVLDFEGSVHSPSLAVGMK
ncbi:MAG: TolB family protein [Flavobacteriales bacterium]